LEQNSNLRIYKGIFQPLEHQLKKILQLSFKRTLSWVERYTNQARAQGCSYRRAIGKVRKFVKKAAGKVCKYAPLAGSVCIILTNKERC